MYLKPGKSTGPDRCHNELTKTMTDEEFQIVKMWVNEILTEDTSRQRAPMNGIILQLHKGGHTNKIGPTSSSLAKQRVSIAELCHQ